MFREIFELLTPPDYSLFFSRGDSNDPRMGDLVLKDRENFSNVDVAIIGVPQDEGVKRNMGRTGASKAPDQVRKYFYRLTPFNFKFKNQITKLRIFDLGNLRVDGSLEQIHERLAFVVGELVKAGILPIVIGGGHDIAFPDYCGFAGNFGKGKRAVINIDTHLDVRELQPRNSGTPFRQILESEFKPDKMFEIGIQNYANSIYHFEYALKNGVKIFTLDEIREKGIDLVLDILKNELLGHVVHLSFDMDSVRNADAPGVSATYPDGLKAEEVLKIALFCGLNLNVKVVDIAEVNPEFDVDGKTSRLASLFILNFLTGKANSEG
ncbi:formiminoglutamase [Candidatus Kryptobacter tengchongensis]|nr:formiminoglutamase [Candidatus Kryptobacter tengchongensis]